MTQEHFGYFLDDIRDNLPEVILSNYEDYGLSRLDVMLLLIEDANGNDLREFVDIIESKHAYRIKKELVGVLADWSFGDPYLVINDDGHVGHSSDCEGHKYSRSEFEALPETIQNLFDEVEEEK
ncbi:hypothetical protein Q757_04280 [Oenococcus alcoholitolerans]|uniref:Uncharacterized protein n=1 Tax=Oenococcus alcoholitolerans TaxID=931074 RepID=A0ABR4XQY9_9LACO|nr:hypothetical protein Q757_04280 [Oenococcus alcoholitolerans]